MGPDPEADSPIRPQYAGEDTRLTSRKELAGWYAYAFAAEVFIICGMGQLQHWGISIWILQSRR
jgi:MFS transporter, UMF1 family